MTISFDQYLGLTDEMVSPTRTWGEFASLLEKLDARISHFISEQVGGLDRSLTRVFFGAGGHGRYLLQTCRALNIPVDYFSDNDLADQLSPWLPSLKKQHTYVDGIYVLNPSELADLANHRIVIATNIPRFRRQIRCQLEDLGLNVMGGPECHLYEAVIIKSYLDFYSAHIEQLREVFDNLGDDRSSLVYLSILKARIVPYDLTGTIYETVMEGDQYWILPEFKNIEDAVFIDAGAAAGDTVRKFLANNSQSWAGIYAFEPDQILFKSLTDNLQDMKSYPAERFQCIPNGLGSFSPERPSRRVTERKSREPLSRPQTMELPEPTNLTTVDATLAGRRASFIKADIEGFERDMLEGAAETIRRWKPHLAICIYHLPGDLFEIPLYIKKLVPKYKMAIRHHSADLPETVLYCWI